MKRPSPKELLSRLRRRLLDLLARVIAPMHPTNKSGNNMSQR